MLRHASRRSRRAIFVAAMSLSFTIACAAPHSKKSFYDGPNRSDPIAANRGGRECGFLVGDTRVGHWIRYSFGSGGRVEVCGDDFYSENGENEGVQAIYEGRSHVADVSAYRDGVEDGINRSMDSLGNVKRLGYMRNHVEIGWHYDFERGIRRLYEEGRVVREETLGASTRGLELFPSEEVKARK